MSGITKTALLAGVLAFCAAAQADPPTLIRIIRAVSLPGAATGSVQPYIGAKTTVLVLGLASISGLSETWLMEAHEPFESIESVDKALNANSPTRDFNLAPITPDDLLPASRTLIGLYRLSLSYRPEEAMKSLPKARYVLVSIYRIRPGTEAAFVDLSKQRRARYDIVNLDRPEIAYQVLSGTASGTFLFVSPLNSLKTLDDALAKAPPFGDGARGTSTAPAPDSHELLIFRIEPRLSYVPDEFASEDPDFWTPKPK